MTMVVNEREATLIVRAPGPPGPKGDPGGGTGDGTSGADGKSVLSGWGPPPSALGQTGEFYIDTSRWWMYGPKAGTWPNAVSLIGPPGPAGSRGADGRTLLSDIGTPGAGVGSDGDFYIATDSHYLFGPKAGGAWPPGVSLSVPSPPGVDATISANTKGFVFHGATATTARPTGYGSVEWMGSVEPVNSIDHDTWTVTP